MDVPVFSISANPTCLYLTRPLKEAVVRFRRAILRKQGLCCILGDNGLGKSSLLKFLASGYETDHDCNVSYFSDSRKFKTSFEFLKMISADFGISPKRSQTAQMDALEEFFTENHKSSRTTIVFIDEAQRLSLVMLELVRAMLNYETDTHKLVQIVLSGQLNLRDRLLEPDYRAVRSRIVSPLLMTPLRTEETVAMIEFRLEQWNVVSPFAREALYRIHELSSGIPREIMLLAQGSYDYAQDNNHEQVTAEHVEAAAQLQRIEDPESIEAGAGVV